jgi:hypothetical protein
LELSDELKIDPVPTLLDLGDDALTYSVRRDLQEEPAPSVETLWELPGAVQLARQQLPEGSWNYARKGLTRFRDHQEADGLWPTGYAKGRKARWDRCWVGLAVCRVLKRYLIFDTGLDL